MTSEQERGDDRDHEAAAWAAAAGELADWCLRWLVNRTDIHGGQFFKSNGEIQRFTSHRRLTRDRLVRHFRATSTEDVIGLHVTSPAETCRWVGWDIDAHKGQKFDPVANLALAKRIFEEARDAGLAVRLIDSSGGKSGYHLWVVFAEPIAMADAFRLGRYLARGHADFGIAKAPEVFPKNDHLTGKLCGHWLRLPGRHHKRPSWSRIWSPKREIWRTGDEAIDALLSLTGAPVDVAAIVPAEFTGRKPKSAVARKPGWKAGAAVVRRSERHRGAGHEDRAVELARQALKHYPNADLHYDDWLQIGMALKNLADQAIAFDLWDDWSAQSAKYDVDVTSAKWETFRPSSAEGDVTLGTLFWRAKENGWIGPAFEVTRCERGVVLVTHRSRRKGTVVIPSRPVEQTQQRDP